MQMQILPGRYPGTVVEYLAESRQCRVSIPGITDGAEIMPLAEIEYAVGDKASHKTYGTEIEMLEGDAVWLAFIGGDSRYPIITGARNPNTGNSTEWRRFHHANIELMADSSVKIIASDGESSVTLSGSGITVNAKSAVTVKSEGEVKVDGSAVTLNGGAKGGVVCQTNICALTGSAHIDASATVTAG